ncbi:MAG: phosphotriesterase-related protein, partial [bacterium]
MAMVNSVLGPLETSQLGFTLMHEHLLCGFAGVSENWPQLLAQDFMGKIIDGLSQAREADVTTVVDATTIDLGRDVNVMVDASRRSGVNVIACAGWWLDTPPFFEGVSADQFADLFIREVREGMCGTDVKAGILKGASDIAGVTVHEEIILRGVARAHLETKAPIMLHSYALGRVGVQQLAILREEGVD